MSEPAVDFTLLELEPPSASAGNRRALMWLGGMLLLVAVSIGVLALFLRSVEAEEANRRRVADAQWLDQTLRFHFQRLEADLTALALQAQRRDAPAASAAGESEGEGTSPALPVKAGQLWRTAGVILFHRWLPAEQQRRVRDWPDFMQAAARQPDGEPALQTMLATTGALQRAAYAGPLPQGDPEAGHILWLAVPQFEQGQFVGDHVAAVHFEQALRGIIPPWFARDHAIDLNPQGGASATVPIHFPGIQLSLDVRALNPQHALAPRLFFGVALVCLLAMMAALYALWRDTVRRQRVEAQLQTQRVLRQAMERAVLLGLRAWDTQGRPLYVNQAFCRLVGWPAEALVDPTQPMPYWPGASRDELDTLRAHMSDPSAPQIGVEMQWRHRDGHLLEVLVHGAPLSLPDGTVVGWMGSALDITERKRIERRAARQQDMLEASGRLIAVGEVASTLAHELNQPLGALSSFANGLLNRLRDGTITPEELHTVVQRMAQLAERAGGVIQRVNAFARRRELNLGSVDFTALVRRAVAAAQEAHATAMVLDLPAQPLWVQGDALLLEHLVHNLCGNALDWAQRSHTRPQVQVRLHTGTNAQVTLAVADSGPGVPEAERARIFDAFFSTKDGGMGMGLAICRSITEAHHGRIVVGQDETLGGALFTVQLPLATAPATAPSPAP